MPATTLAISCYNRMFKGCTGITMAPKLPATELAVHCYESMFQGCTSLTQAPELLAITLADYCYYDMFEGCTGLTKAPKLPATTLACDCYDWMFLECTSLALITCLASELHYLSRRWVKDVSKTGTFTKKKGADWETGDSGIPKGWAVIEVE